MGGYFHSVTLDADKCKGCTNCIKRCPTEAIRVRDGKAVIIEERCIDCGECIRICPNHAKLAATDSLGVLRRHRRTVALVAPSFYGQFREGEPGRVAGAVLATGFDAVYEVALAADAVTAAMRYHLDHVPGPRPLISAACPAVLRLVLVRFPALIEHVLPVESPMEIAARAVKDATDGDVGVYFITPCPAKVTAIKQPVGSERSAVDGALAMSAVYAECLRWWDAARPLPGWPRASGAGLGWGRAGGETVAVGGSSLAVDGIHNVIRLLEEVERRRWPEIEFIEAQACTGGCVGGCLAVENPFIARLRLRRLAAARGAQGERAFDDLEERLTGGYFGFNRSLQARPVLRLDDDVERALSKLRRLEATETSLPGLDCGSCGSPSCRALAEDIVRGLAYETDCVFKLRERVHTLAEEMVDLARRVPPAMGRRQSGADARERDDVK